MKKDTLHLLGTSRLGRCQMCRDGCEANPSGYVRKFLLAAAEDPETYLEEGVMCEACFAALTGPGGPHQEGLVAQ